LIQPTILEFTLEIDGHQYQAATMAQFAHSSIIALRLPDPRFSVDFENYGIDAKKASATSRKYMHDLFPGQNKPLPPPKTELKQRHRAIRATPTSRERQFRRVHQEGSLPAQKSKELPEEFFIVLEMPPSPRITDIPIASTNSIGARESSSATPLTQIARSPICLTDTSLENANPKHSLLEFPQSVLEHILGYVFGDSRTVSITPYQSHIQPSQKRRKREINVDIRSMMMHPVLLVSHQVRMFALDVIYRENLFVIDLVDHHTIHLSDDKDANKYWNSWMGSTPTMVKTALIRAANIRVRLPVSNTETPSKSKVKSHNALASTQDCLRILTSLISNTAATTSDIQSRSASPSRHRALRPKLGITGIRMPRSLANRNVHHSLEFVCRGDAPPRQPLDRLEIVLVKPSANAAVLPETLELLATCNSVPVQGDLEYCVELEGKRRLWAKRMLGRWVGKEPDGQELLKGMCYICARILGYGLTQW
jgi:hypothetical protein